MGNVLIVWFGISGKSAAKLCLNNGYNVYVYDEKDIREFGLDEKELSHYIFIDKTNLFSNKTKFEFAVISPAVLPGNEIHDFLQSKGIVMLSEIELGYRYCDGNIIAITGTNGKTSTAWICSRVFEMLGKDNGVYGNLGIGFAETSPKIACNETIILEVSAQHLHATELFHPHISVITNINPEHQSNYVCFEDYVNDKYKIFANQQKNDYCILNYDDTRLAMLENKINATVLGFSKKQRLKKGASFLNGTLYIDENDYHRVIYLGTSLRRDYIEHILIVALILKILDISFDDAILKLIPNIKFEDRLEVFNKFNKRLFVNDSKATNPYSTIFALESFTNIVLICGSNLKKKNDYHDLIRAIEKKGCWVVLYRESGEILFQELEERKYEKMIYVKDLKDAIEQAYEVSNVGDVIVFSPGGNSSPLYENLYERGRIFKELTNSFLREKNI